MDYKEKYEEALDKAKEIYCRNDATDGGRIILEGMFPELKESEDEKIRKEIIQSIQDNMCVIHKDKCIAWLEKQGEQKPTPKFKIGDTIHKIGENTVFPMTIEKIEDGYYVCNNNHSFVNIKFQDDYELVEQKSSWSEKDESEVAVLEAYIRSRDWSDRHIDRALGIVDELVNKVKSIKPSEQEPSEELLKDLPKWKRNKPNEKYIHNKGYYLAWNELENLPKEE